MALAESLVSLQRAVLLASRALSGQVASARPATAAVHHALQTATTALSADVAHSGSLLARHAYWKRASAQHLKLGAQLGARGYSVAHATAAASAEPGLIVTDKAIQVRRIPGKALVLHAIRFLSYDEWIR